jgi:hypothetical protein
MNMKAKLAGAMIALVLLSYCVVSRGPGRPDRPRPGTSLLAPTALDEATARQTSGHVAEPDDHLHEQSEHRRAALRPSPEARWNQPVTEPEFARFADWTRRYAQAPTAAAQASLEAEGVLLARARLTALADLIVHRPERALDLSVPASVRAGLPAAIAPLLEEPVNTRGDYEVLCVLALPGQERPSAPMIRVARINGTAHRVFTFGSALDYVTRTDAPLNGIAVPASAATVALADPVSLRPAKLLALDPRPARLLDASERETRAGGAPVAVEFAGAVQAFATLAEAEDWASQQTAEALLEVPQTPPTAESSYTEGRKRFLVMRVDFPDYTVDVFPTNTAVQHMLDMSNFLAEISYGKHVIAPVGQGTDITPIMRMSEVASAYDSAGLSKLYPEAREVARTNFGYDLSKYDFFFVCTGSRPSYSYAGLGYVGGVGYHLANSYFNVRTSAHEFGHNLGLGHANWWDTGGRSTLGTGASEEYGDSFDTMGGSGGGRRHFSASFKARLGWIPASDAPTVTSSGIYRLHAHDIATAPVGLRAIRLNRASGDPYWIEFRQLWTDYKALFNGVNFRWAGGSSQLLDMNPGSSAGKDDHSLTIGRTFSDWSRNFHVTPLRKGNTYPESMDVAIYFGPFPTNLPPAVSASATPLTAGTGQTITFAATASDPNGDTLAYAWDFGDGDYSVDNSPVTTRSFSGAGEYNVSVTVSDLKGGTARDTVIVRVGNPSTFSISGRVLDGQGRGMAGIKVSVNASRYAFTESDGTYTLTRLAAGSYTVTAVEPVADAYTFLSPFFNNPVTVGPSFTPADFMVATNAPAATPIIARRSSWNYLDDGSNQGTAWTALGFNDSAWASGAGVLGYTDGNDEIHTTLSYGPDANNKYLTYYFRKTFVLTNLAAYTNFPLEILRDDGVVVHVNGAEVYRNNMPSGTITYLTTASSTTEPDTYLGATLPASAFVSGTNIIAAEVHQANATSSDIGFDLALSGTSATNAMGLRLVYLAQPSANATFVLPTNVPLSAFAQSGLGAASLVEFYTNGVKIVEDTSAPFAQVWSAPPAGRHTLHAVATFSGTLVTSAPVVITVSAPTAAAPPLALTLIPTNAVWKYLAGPTAAPPTWAEATFEDGAWPSGPAQLGFGEDDEATVIPGGPSNNRYATIYFRHAFGVNDPAALTNLTLLLRRDDGAVVYLNGTEILRDNLPPGPLTYGTLATNAADDGATLFAFSLSPDALRVGPNLLAAEVHQSALSSSDLSFELGLNALAGTNRSRGVWITAPADGASVPLPGNVDLTAEVVAGGTLGVSRMEFFANGVKVGETSTRPYRVTWADPPAGAYQITAVATDTADEVFASAPVGLTVNPPPRGTALVSFGESWKYLDNGSDQGTNWTGRFFDDRTWKAGPARLGYGGDGEITTVSYGSNPGARYVTTYFRKAFMVQNPVVFSGLLLRVVRDHGVVVYLNGREVFRDNLLPGLVTFNSLALTAIGGADETTPLDVPLPLTGLVFGTNVLAAEVHQSAINSSDLGFDLALTGLTASSPAQGIVLTSPAQGARFNPPARVELTAFVSNVVSVTRVEYFAGEVRIGESALSPYRVVWSNALAGSYTLTALASLAGGGSLTSAPVAVTVASPSPPIEPVFAPLIAAGADWKYWDNAQAVGAGWTQPGFNDAAWPTGLARFGWGWDGERTLLTEGRITHYFRRWFNVANPALLNELVFQLARDDGAVVYLNGREVFRSNMPSGTITASTLASSTVNTPDETTYFETALAVAGSGLSGGSNLVAVELHQSSATSSDGGFDLQLVGYGTTEPRVLLASPANGAVLSSTTPIVLEAFAVPPANAVVTRMEFFAGGIKLGESTAAPFRFVWSTPAYGPHELTARMTASSGFVLDSPAVTIEVARELVVTTLVPSNSVWKYLDNGSNQGTNWAQPGFNDGAWAAGPARLGYGGKGEVTVVASGPANNKYITTYFRQTFVVPGGVLYTGLTFRLVRDDGAVIWLNGREVYRSNMPAGAITYTTRAAATVTGADEQAFFPTTVDASWLVPGTNVLAVEAHQINPTSSDLGFNLELTAIGYTDDLTTPTLTITLADGLLELSWPETAVGYRVYTSLDLSLPAGEWTPLNEPPVTVSGRRLIVVQPTAAAQYFQLGKP